MASGTRCSGKEHGSETARTIIALNPDPGAGGRAARGGAAGKDLANDHAAAAARAWQAMIGRDVRIGCITRVRWIGGRQRSGDQLPGTRNVGLAAGTGEQPIVADAMSAFLWSIDVYQCLKYISNSVVLCIPFVDCCPRLTAIIHAAMMG